MINGNVLIKAVGETEDRAKFNVCIEGIQKFK